MTGPLASWRRVSPIKKSSLIVFIIEFYVDDSGSFLTHGDIAQFCLGTAGRVAMEGSLLAAQVQHCTGKRRK